MVYDGDYEPAVEAVLIDAAVALTRLPGVGAVTLEDPVELGEAVVRTTARTPGAEAPIRAESVRTTARSPGVEAPISVVEHPLVVALVEHVLDDAAPAIAAGTHSEGELRRVSVAARAVRRLAASAAEAGFDPDARVDELVRLVLDEMPRATSRDLAADGAVGDEESAVWGRVVAAAEGLR